MVKDKAKKVKVKNNDEVRIKTKKLIQKKRKKLDGELLQKKEKLDEAALMELITAKTKKKLKSLKKKKLKRKKVAIEGEDEEADDAGPGDAEAGKPLQGMDKWIAEYNARRPGLAVLQEQLDSFIADFEEREEQARQERQAAAGGDGWTVVSRQKGKKRTTDAASGVAVGAFAAAAAADAAPKTQTLEDFYKFQRRDAHRNELLQLKLKFQEDKKKIAQMRAARKFRPY